MAEQKNPYAAPSAPVADFHPPQDRGTFIKEGQVVPAGHGWDWWRRGFAIFRASPWMWMVITVVMMGIFFAAGAVFAGLGFGMTRSPATVFALMSLLALAFTVLYPVFEGGLMLAARAADEGEAPHVGHLFAGFNQAGGTLAAVGGLLLVANIVIQFVVGMVFAAWMAKGMTGDPVAMMQRGALVLLVYLALAIPLIMAFWFAPALVVFNGLSALEAMRCSFVACLKNLVPFLIYGLVGLALSVVLLLVMGIFVAITRGFGLILIIVLTFSILPIILGSIYAGYRDIYTAQRS